MQNKLNQVGQVRLIIVRVLEKPEFTKKLQPVIFHNQFALDDVSRL